jgi:hypothetical protein
MALVIISLALEAMQLMLTDKSDTSSVTKTCTYRLFAGKAMYLKKVKITQIVKT